MKLRASAAGGLFGGLFFLWIAGWRVIDPTEFAWLMKLDWRINFLGWHLFRNEPWRIPPGRIESYLSGEGTSIGFTDSVPFAALLFKPFDPWLPTPFQYFGVWLLICFILQGVFGALVTSVWTRRPWLQITGALLFVLVPTLLIRVGHPALTAHFLLLWALWIYLRRDTAHPAPLVSQAALGVCAGLIHPYLAAMTLAMLASVPLRDRTRRSLAAFAAAVAGTVASWWVAGFISVSNTTDLSAGGLGLYSMNLLSPITPSGWSTLLPDQAVAHEQQTYEGFQYLGVGNLALVLSALVIAAVTRPRVSWATVAPLAIVCTLNAIYALSPRVTMGSAVVIDWSNEWIDRVAFFRASGRFFWPMTYLLIAGSIAIIVSRLRPRMALMVLAAAVALQFIDQRTAYAERRAASRSDAFHTWSRRLVSPVWNELLGHYEHIVLVPASQCGGAPLEHEELAFLAGLSGVSINSGLGARWDEAKRRRYCAQLGQDVANGVVHDRTLYIVTPEYEQRLRAAARVPVVCGDVDAARVCVSAASYRGGLR
jgi:hypothetical protein